MSRVTIVMCCLFVVAISSATQGKGISGSYIEARTCQVYTGPCFANGEVGLGGKNALMSWSISSGSHAGVDLAGLKVMVLVRASDTLGFDGLNDAKSIKSMIVVDETATDKQRQALIGFAKSHAGKAGKYVASVRSAPFKMNLDKTELKGKLEVGRFVKLESRKARPSDCICSNESAYYPPLAKLAGCAPGVTIQGEVKAHGIGSSWSIPDTRTSYLGTFEYK